VLLGIPHERLVVFAYGAVTRYGGAFQSPSANDELFYSLPDRQIWWCGPTTPDAQRLPALTRVGFGLFRFRSPLLTESRLLSLPVGNEMFHFPTFPPPTLCVQVGVTGHDSCRVSPFGHPRITARLAAPRGFSQPPTSFFGSWCLGIHRAPLLTWPQRCSRPLCSSQATGGPSLGSPRTPPRGAVRREAGPDPMRHRSPCGHRRLIAVPEGGLDDRSLRTQQRARPAPTRSSRAPCPRAVLARCPPQRTE
jgi:hypothetical protein